MKISIENDNMKVSIDDATPEESGRILAQMFGYKPAGMTREEPIPVPGKRAMSPETRRAISAGRKKYWANLNAAKKPARKPMKTHSRRIQGAPADMLTPSNTIKYAPFLGTSITKFVRERKNMSSDDLIKLILSKLPVRTPPVERRVRIAVSLQVPRNKTDDVLGEPDDMDNGDSK